MPDCEEDLVGGFYRRGRKEIQIPKIKITNQTVKFFPPTTRCFVRASNKAGEGLEKPFVLLVSFAKV